MQKRSYFTFSLTKEQKKLILIEFTSELIRNQGGQVFELESIIEKRAEKKEEIQKESKKVTEIVKKERELTEPIRFGKKSTLPLRQPPKNRPRVLRIPPPRLPQRFQYLKPLPMEKEIDLGEKLNPFIKDSGVQSIECNGPDEIVKVSGTMGTKPTGIKLEKEEIDAVIEKFSKATKIPYSEGIFRVAYGRLMFLAVVSEIIGSKFVIKKLISTQQQNPQPNIFPGKSLNARAPQ